MKYNFYLRNKEKIKILNFLKSDLKNRKNKNENKKENKKENKNQIKIENKNENHLHIIGIPGTGKTLVVKEILKNKKHLYFNYLEDNLKLFNKNIKIKNSDSKIIVIDEFDKFYENEKQTSIKILERFHNSKIITISNNLLPIYKNILIFEPYKTEEIFYILNKKSQFNESECKIISKKVDGDLRKALNFNFIESNTNENIHMEILKEIIDNNYECFYEKYVEKCKFLKLKSVSKDDFEILCDIILEY